MFIRAALVVAVLVCFASETSAFSQCGIVTPHCKFTKEGAFDPKNLKKLVSGMICNRERNIFVMKSKKACCRPRGEGPIYDFIYDINLMLGDLDKIDKTDPVQQVVLATLAGFKDMFYKAGDAMGVELPAL